MNAVEIEEAVSNLVEASFNQENFPYAFLQAFGVNDAGVRKLKSGDANKSDLPGGVLQRNKNNIHLLACAPGEVATALASLRSSPATAKHKARFILATDGQTLQAERFDDGEVLACDFKDLPNRFAYFLSLAGISTVKRIDENAFDIRATGRLNKLYVELLNRNPDWDTDARREDLNHFFARLIFCFFAEDTGIFDGIRLFTDTVDRMTERTGGNVHEVLSEIFRAMNVRLEDRADAGLRPYSLEFPYVNGNLFSGSTETPKFTQSARNYLLFVGGLDWKKINPDIFGSMIQAVADDEERGTLGMHYTSVPNILKVLNPLFLDDLRQKLTEAGDGSTPASKGQLKRLRDRMARIRVFDPACGSGNFLVIAYKEMRQIEAVINERRGERELPSVIPSTNFRGIEIRHFAAEIARLALIIAKFQCDALHISHLFARNQVLPLDKDNWITCGNALRLDWLQICPPTGTGVKIAGDDLFNTPKDQAEIDFENAGGETYICGNPPYLGSRRQEKHHKDDLKELASPLEDKWRSLDYVSAWLFKARAYQATVTCTFAFVTTSSLCEGLHISILWRHILDGQRQITFAHRPFKWRNLAQHNAGVSVVVVGVSNASEKRDRFIFDDGDRILAANINPYLINGNDVFVSTRPSHLSALPLMMTGAMPRDGGNLILSRDEEEFITGSASHAIPFIRRYMGSEELINGKVRYCVWVEDGKEHAARTIPAFVDRFERVRLNRLESPLQSTIDFADYPHRFVYVAGQSETMTVAIGAVSSENRPYLPVDCLPPETICSNRLYAIYNGTLVDFAILESKMHLAWAFAVCGRLEQRLSYSNTLGWNTFPVPALSESNKGELTRRAEEILLAREAHFPATIAEMYDPERMDAEFPNLRAAHDRNDETLERIYIGRRFRNDTERLEKLFEMYTAMTGGSTGGDGKKAPKGPRSRQSKSNGGITHE